MSDISSMFHMSPQSLSQIINKTVMIILENNEDILTNLDNLHWLDRNTMQYYAEVNIQ